MLFSSILCTIFLFGFKNFLFFDSLCVFDESETVAYCIDIFCAYFVKFILISISNQKLFIKIGIYFLNTCNNYLYLYNGFYLCPNQRLAFFRTVNKQVYVNLMWKCVCVFIEILLWDLEPLFDKRIFYKFTQ